MSTFELWSLIAYYLQLLLIGGGLWLMQRAGQRRDKQLDRQEQRMEELLTGNRLQNQALERLLERSA